MERHPTVCSGRGFRGNPRQLASGVGRRRLVPFLQGLWVGRTLALGAALLTSVSGAAQSPLPPALPLPAIPLPTAARLSVRPSIMATGMRTLAAGEQVLDSVPAYNGQHARLYVPPQCVGTRRCPLLVHNTYDGMVQPRLADKYGIITLSSTGFGSNVREELSNVRHIEYSQPDTRDRLDNGRIAMEPRGSEHAPRVVRRLDPDSNLAFLDAVLKYVLRKFAIDPERIAIVGESVGGGGPSLLGSVNPDVFSRVIVSSPGAFYAGTGPRNGKTQYLITVGLTVDDDLAHYWMWAVQGAQWARRSGYPVEMQITFDGHGFADQEEVEHHICRWLAESWGIPDPGAPPLAPGSDLGSVPALTPEALERMTAFWTWFGQEPDSIGITAFKRYRKRLTIPVGLEQMTLTDMTDMAALAAAYPSVAAALQKAGLTAREEESYAVALLSARVTNEVSIEVGIPPAMSTQARNLAFLSEHSDELLALTIACKKYLPVLWDAHS